MNGVSFRLNHSRTQKKGRRALIVAPSSAGNATWA